MASSTSLATVPASVTVAAGSTTAAFTIQTQNVPATTSATVTASYNGSSEMATLTMTAPVVLSSILVNPISVIRGISATGTVTLSAPALTGDVTVYLWTDGSPAFVPTSVTVPAGSKTAVFTVQRLTFQALPKE